MVSLRLSSDFDEPGAIPYFLWDEPMSADEFRARLAGSSAPERDRLLAKLLREARDTEVWRFTSLEIVAESFPRIEQRLGRRWEFWRFLLDGWKAPESSRGAG